MYLESNPPAPAGFVNTRRASRLRNSSSRFGRQQLARFGVDGLDRAFERGHRLTQVGVLGVEESLALARCGQFFERGEVDGRGGLGGGAGEEMGAVGGGVGGDTLIAVTTGDDEAYDVTIQPDGKILMAYTDGNFAGHVSKTMEAVKAYKAAK